MTPRVARGAEDRGGAQAARAGPRGGGLRRPDGRKGHRGAEGSDPARHRHARRDGRGDRRRRRGAALPHAPGRRAAGRRSSTPAVRAASGETSSISRPRRRSSRPVPAPRSPSTATARSPRASARRTSSPPAASPIELEPGTAGRILDEVGLVFLFAPSFHPAMKELGTVRRELGIRTIFNALGPLGQPGRAPRAR